jgi:hypothetical protein
MSETFVPLVSASSGAREANFTSLNLQSFPQANGHAAPAGSLATPGARPTCAKPVVTLQRNGEIVSGIRIQCGCGEIIELNCIY